MFQEEYKTGELNRNKYRCRVCDGPVEPVQLVCYECDRRDDELIERDTYMEFAKSEDEAYRQLKKEKTVLGRSSVKG